MFGKSLGTASVVFAETDSALNAFNQYNNIPLDGIYNFNLSMSLFNDCLITKVIILRSSFENRTGYNFVNYRQSLWWYVIFL